jgi:hypothetical protein
MIWVTSIFSLENVFCKSMTFSSVSVLVSESVLDDDDYCTESLFLNSLDLTDSTNVAIIL